MNTTDQAGRKNALQAQAAFIAAAGPDPKTDQDALPAALRWQTTFRAALRRQK